MRYVGHLTDEDDIADDLDDIGIDIEFVPLTQNYVEFDYGQSDQDYQSTASTQVPTSIPPVDLTTSHATGTPSVVPATGDHTSTQTRRSTPTAKRQKTRATTHVLDMGINMMTTELSHIITKLVIRREFDWAMGSKVEPVLQGVTRFDMTYLFTVLEVIMKEKSIHAWFLGADDGTRRGIYVLDLVQIAVLY
ncbi:hypothetical protein GIB67_030805, partial [Kingdonia uniflora]